jgi:hypothetical protein
MVNQHYLNRYNKVIAALKEQTIDGCYKWLEEGNTPEPADE